jgi:hypothetical protein
MNIRQHSRCHYKRNSGSAPAGTNNPPRWRACGATKPLVAHRCPLRSGQTAAAMTLGRTLLRRAPRPCPHSRGEDKLSEPKSRRSEARMVALIPSATGTSSATATSAPTTGAVCPPADPHTYPPGRAGHRPPRKGVIRGKGRTAPEHERRPSSARCLGRSSGARSATTALAAGGGTGRRARGS